jgi:hypothetical protein
MHTPGPWHYVGDSLTHCQFDIYSPGAAPRQHICTVNNLSVEALWKRDAQQAEANARLIAAAPALLEALRLAANINPYGSVENANARDAARAAIARATGKD